ncbi:tigger transposable element-derived protein 6-like protein [Lasius niger]|uniref:Tigger transposable element-derived protein 6-like protein n=1 Tax=Lasius niger TaxID=67767 RepID=A0A0J7MZB4_LASNI|nr:tigger transposable element-derived protein 6-like protein [Lasius niger]
MPKVKKDNKYQKKYCEKQIEDAIHAVKNRMSQHAASRQYGVPRSTIQFRMNNAFVKTTPGPPPVLGRIGEDELVNWIIDCQRKGFPMRKINVQTSVKEFLNHTKIKNPFRNNTPGNGWYKSLLRRNPILTERHPEGVTNASSCVSQNDIRNWFKEIYNYLAEHNYLYILEDPRRIFNSDETYFIVCPKMKNVIAPRGTRNVYEIDRGNSKLNLTVLFTFSASGVTTPPTVVFPYKRLPACVGRSVPNDWGIGVTPSGWMNAELFYKYLKNIFYPYLKKEKIEFPVILFVDGHSSHVTLEVSKLCSELEIILICLYPNSTRMLQPADVSAFKPLKSMWKKSVLEWRQQNPTQSLSLDGMAPILKNAVDKFSPDGNTVRNGFKTCGLYPWNPDAVDYTKCLGVKTKNIEAITISRPSNATTISFEMYAKVVGDDLLEELQLFSSQQVTAESKSAEFLILHKLFEEYTKVSNSTNTIIAISDKTDNNIKNLKLNNILTINKNESHVTDDLELNNIAIDETGCDIILYNLDVNNEIATDKIEGDILNDLELNNIVVIDKIESNVTNDLGVNNIAVIDEIKNNVTNDLEVNNIAVIDEIENNVTNDLGVNDNIDDLELNKNMEIFDETKINESINNLEVSNIVEMNEPACNKINNLELHNDLTADKTENKVLDLSLSHRKDCSKTLKDFLPRPITPKRKGKKFTERTSYAISSFEWKLKEEEKLERIKMKQKRKDDKKPQMLEKKKLAEKLKEQKKFARLQKQQEKKQKTMSLKIKKEKIDNKENTDNEKPKRTRKNND